MSGTKQFANLRGLARNIRNTLGTEDTADTKNYGSPKKKWPRIFDSKTMDLRQRRRQISLFYCMDSTF